MKPRACLVWLLLALLGGLSPAWAAGGTGLQRSAPDFQARFKVARPADRRAVVRQNGVRQTALDLRRSYLKTLNTRYKVEVPLARLKRPAKDQQQSGRCWIFATTNVLESGLVSRGAKRTDLSESFANYHAWRTRAHALLGQLLSSEKPVKINLASGFSEGGWFAWAGQLIEQHGMVPRSAMPDTVDAANSDLLINRLQGVMAVAQRRLRGVKAGPGAAARRQTIARETERSVDTLLDTLLGKPPESFTHRGKTFTPQKYAREVLQFQPREYVLLANLPSRKLGWNTGYRAKGIHGMPDFPMYNVSSRNMEAAVRATIDRGESVFFSAQVGSDNPHMVDGGDKVPSQARNALHLGAFDYRSVLPVPFPSKRDRFESEMDWAAHAMSFVGYDYDQRAPGKVTKFKVHNSWGLHQHLYADFFREYVDTVVVPKDSLPPALRRKLDAHPVKRDLPLTIPY